MDHKKVASEVVKAVGKDNVVAAAHCATRLRLVLKDDSKVDQAALDNNDDVKGTFKQNGQYQIIIGPGDVNNVYDYFVKETGVKEASTDDLKEIAQNGKKPNPIMAFVKLLSDIFVPLIPALVAGGLLMALNSFITSAGLFGPKSVVQMVPQLKTVSGMIQVMASAPFIFLPIMVGFSAAKRFGANPFLGGVIGMMMTSPSLVDGHFWNLFGMHVSQTPYTYQVIPVLVAVWVLSILEKFFHKHLPTAVDFTFTPLLSVIITGFLTFVAIGPVMREASNLITDAIVWLYNTTGAFGMGVFGACYSPIVLTGLHQSFPAVEVQLISAFTAHGQGVGDFIFIVASMANVAQGAATFALMTLTKDKKTKSLASSAGVSALLGITEPAIFGVNLKFKFPFFCALVGSCIASFIAGIFRVGAIALGSAGFLGFLSVNPKSIIVYVICELISFAIAFAITFIYGKTHAQMVNPVPVATSEAEAVEMKEADVEPAQKNEVSLINEIVKAPVNGQVKDLSEVNDKVFSQKLMGDGAAIVPTDGTIYAPVDGKITVAYETKHAYGIQSDNGAEVLIHIGIDTVNLKGEHFETFVKQGQEVKQGDKLGTIDIDAVQKAGYDPTVMTIITNTANYAEVGHKKVDEIHHGDDFIKVVAK
ncbi:MAG TPA: sucrose-specific PTS transporter subunit IIBC [Candidatus Ligilactobacillus excrementigallinarum]|uniref:PTS system sucrose-specific EIIBCA component n=1 Tax=Candidatus Ligilactobacillus excrementigallinarum TaxID=2838641 RepID=A0A9D1UWX1_9LACO|nr:sucrose-specific PTS transporter subunit IIBC [Candidatus Ligilactobacillus excrementigallinarum]